MLSIVFVANARCRLDVVPDDELGTCKVYNQLRQYDKAESWFHQAVNLKGGTPEREDIWNLAICKKNMGQYEEAG